MFIDGVEVGNNCGGQRDMLGKDKLRLINTLCVSLNSFYKHFSSQQLDIISYFAKIRLD